MALRVLTALPVFNEQKHVDQVLRCVKQHAHDVLVVDDGSTDGTAEILRDQDNIFSYFVVSRINIQPLTV